MRLFLTILLLAICQYSFSQKVEYGLASIYSNDFAGGQTSSGAEFDPDKHTAAHKSLPYGSIVRVTNLENNRSIMVKINDRGPFIRGFVIEMSSSAAEAIRLKGNKPKVKLEVEKEEAYPESSELIVDTYDYNGDTEEPNPFALDEKEEKEEEKVDENPFTEKKEEEKVTPEEESTSKGDEKKEKKTTEVDKPKELAKINTKGYCDFELYKSNTFIPKASGYGVQIGKYHNLQNVLKQTAILQENWFSKIMLTREIEKDKPIYTVIIGPFDDRESAAAYSKNASKKGVKGFVVAVQPSSTKEVYQIKAVRPVKEGFAVQVMNLNDADNVILEVDKLKKRWFKNILINVVRSKDGKPEYKILLGPLPSRNTANSYKDALKKKNLNGFVVDLSKVKSCSTIK